MKKTHLPTRLLAMVLAFALLFGFAVPVGATGTGEAEITFRQVDNSAVSVDSKTELPVESPSQPDYADTDVVRVSIFLEKDSTVQAGYSTRDIAQNSAAMLYRAGLQVSQCAMTASIERATGEKLDVVWNMTLAANAISANVEYGQIAAIEKLPGVAEVVLETRYEPQETVTDATSKPNMVISTQMTGTNVAWQSGYTGAGMRVAIIDTGLDTDHQSVAPGALEAALRENAAEADVDYEEYLKGLDLLDAEEIARVLPQLNAAKQYAGLTAEDLYISLKAPFGFNYVDSTLDVTHDNDDASEHGSHVAGIAVANRLVEKDGAYVSAADAVGMVGNAPDAQIIVMKVFGQNGGAYDSDYMAALEDAILLGCDSVNMSLGSTLAGESRSETYAELLDSLTKTDTVLVTSMGNNGYWAQYADPKEHLFVEDVNFHTGGSPGSYTNTLTVASVDNDGLVGNTFAVAGKDFVYMETLYRNTPFLTLNTNGEAGTTYDYVMIDGYGTEEDFASVDVAGKIALVRRGEIEFTQKLYNGDSAGAIATVVYNNQPGLFYMDLTYYWGSTPCVSITSEASDFIQENSTKQTAENGTVYYTGKLTVTKRVSSIYSDSDCLSMSSFSSWGVPGDLSLKPEIAAPGGSVYSINGAVQETDEYELMSGTSMAAPQIAGISALVLQHIQTKGLSQEGLTDRALAQSVMMSTATPLKDEDGQYYPVMQQGAGLVDTAAATGFDSYVLVDGYADGKVKTELKDDPTRKGVYSFSFDIHNISDTQKIYALSADVFTQNFFEDYSNYNNNDEQTALYTDTQTTPLDANVLWTVDGRVVSAKGELAQCDFDGDGDVDADDGQALLDYVTGARDAIQALNRADMDGDGDVDTYDVHLFLNKLDNETVTVPAGGSVKIAVTIRLTEEAKAHLDEYFVNGAYVQAYVFANAVGDEEGLLGTSHSIPMLAFYGNWSDGSMLDLGCFQTFQTGEEYRVPYLYNKDTNTFAITYADEPNELYVFGGNPVTIDQRYMPERNAINSENGDRISKLKIAVIRNAADSRFTVTNTQTGEVLQDVSGGEFPAAAMHTMGYGPTSYLLNVDWSPKGLSEGDELELCLTLAPDYYVNDDGSVRWDELGRGTTLKTPVTIDNTAPVLNGVSLDVLTETLNITATDNRHVAAVTLLNGNGSKTLASTGSDPDAGAGEACVYSMDVSQVDGQEFLIQVTDYAMNTATYAIEVNLGELAVPDRIAFNMSSGYWAGFDRNPTWPLPNWMPADKAFCAATILDHMILAATEKGEFYVMPENDPSNMTLVANLGVVLTDMAYNPADGQVYGVADGVLVTVNPLTGAVAEVGKIGIPTNTLACDENGTFYCHMLTDGAVKLTDVYAFTLETIDAPELVLTVELFTNEYTQALEIDPNTGLLCWVSYYESSYGSISYALSYYLEINLEDGTVTQSSMLFNHISCLAIPVKNGGDNWGTTDEVSGIQISRDAMTILKGTEEALSALVLPWTVSDRSIIWTSSDPTVATVDASGVVTGVNVGTCVVTAASALNPSVTASCDVTVETARVTLEGVLMDSESNPMFFTWNLETDDTWTAGVSLDTTLTSATLDTAKGDLYVMDAVKDSWNMHKVDRAIGKTVENSGPNAAEISLWDMAYSDYYSSGEAVRINGIHGEYLLPAKDPMKLDFMAFDLFNILSSFGAQSLTAVTSLGYEQHWDEDSGVMRDTEHLILMDNTGSIWNFWLYSTDDGGMSGMLNGYASTLTGLAFPGDKSGDMDCSLIAGEDGYLYFSYFNGATNQLYRLGFDEANEIYKADLLADFGDAVWPAAIYAASSNEAESQTAAVPTGNEIHVEAVPLTAEAFAASAQEETRPGGTLNGFTGETVRPQSVEHKADCKDKTVTLTLTADGETTNGLYTVSYDASKLTLLDKSGKTELASFAEEDGKLIFGYAGKETMPAGTVLATLTFEAQADTEAVFTVTLVEENDRHPGTAEDVTLTVPEHDYLVSVVPATCEEGGYTLHTCKNCGHSYVDNETPATGHSFGNWEITTAADCFRDGLETRTCHCGETETRVIPASSDHCPSKAFSDLNCSSWYHEGVDYVLSTGLMKGMGNGVFAPNTTVTRGMIVTMLYRLAGEPDAENPTPFTDVARNKYYANAVAWAYENEIAMGVTDTRFAPEAPATREQVVTFLYRYAKFVGMDVSAQGSLRDFSDGQTVSAYAEEAVAWAVGRGLLVGDNGNLLPRDTATRAQLATIIFRFLEK